jgi:hypothetical protein
MKPMILEVVLMRLRIALWPQPKLTAFCKFFREISKNIGQQFAASALRAQNSSYGNKFPFRRQGTFRSRKE